MKKTTIVGIGASAGGLNSIQQLFDHIPSNTGMAFVIIQHLSQDFVSLMPELLAKHTDMQIFTAQDKQVIEPNCIYLNQRNKNLHIKGDKLYLLDKGPKHNLNLPIDIFFHTLGEEYKDNAIGIILSGTGSDGSRGIRTIKEGGGMVIVQEPTSAQFDGMPVMAISTKLADYVAPPKEIAQLLSKTPVKLIEIDKSENSANSNAILFAEILRIIFEHSDIDFREYKRNTLLRRLDKRMQINNIDNLDDYKSFLNGSLSEKDALFDDFLIGVTRFFRDTEAFHELREKVIPSLIDKDKKNESLRIWIAGCSTGEEVYSIAILLDQYLRSKNLNCDFKIFASDVDRDALVIAGKGAYDVNVINEVDPGLLERYFLKTGGKVKMIKRIRDRIVFSHHNLIKDPPFINLDLISCRNLLIYLDNRAQRMVMRHFTNCLNINGYLFLGSSESLGEISPYYETVSTKWKIYQKTKEIQGKVYREGADFSNSGLQYGPEKLRQSKKEFYQSSYSNKDLISENTFYKYLSQKFSPASIFIDEEYNVLFISGDTRSKIALREGMFQNNLLNLVDSSLASILRSGVSKLKKSKHDVSIKDVLNTSGEATVRFDLIFRHTNILDRKECFQIEFSEDKVDVNDEVVKLEPLDLSEVQKQRYEDLENDLKEAKQDLQNAIEELETSNEELQSSNEELMSSNEELQSTNEELQSVNEELYTVNTELQEKNSELLTVHSDLLNLLNKTEIATVFLDSEMKLRKFTPKFQQLFNLVEEDIGRSLASFSSSFNDEAREVIEQNSRKVMSELTFIERHVKDNSGNSFLLRISPFITVDNEIDGVVMTFDDITHLLKTEKSLEEIERQYQTLFQNLNEGFVHGLIITDKKGKPKDWEFKAINTSFENQTGLKAADVVGHLASKVAPQMKDGSEKWLEVYGKTALQGKEQFIEVYSEYIGSHFLVHVFSPRKDEFAATYADITELKKKEEELKLARQHADEANNQKNYFLANMSHEIRTPIAGIIGFSELMKFDDITNEERNQYLTVIDQNSKQLLHLIDDIIDVAKIESDQIRITIDDCSVGELIKNIQVNFDQIKINKGKTQLKFKTQIPEKHKDLVIKTDEHRLQQVINNLLMNALKFSEEGTITFGYELEQSEVRFFVKDQGMGIAEENLKLIFERFKQLNYEKIAKYGGTGLGLAICKGIVTKLGGVISVTSELGKGSEFRFTLPFTEGKTENSQAVNSKTRDVDLSNKTILLADDEANIRLYYERMYSMTGAKLLLAEDGQRAVELYKKNPQIDLVLMDIRMPVLDGHGAIKEILEFDSKAKIIVQSAYVMPEEKERCLKQGCLDYLTKPVSVPTLLKKLEELLKD